jgi:hypothetical protein
MIKRLFSYIPSSIACLFAGPAFGQSNPDVSLRATATTSYETNPFLFADNDTETLKLQLQVQPEAKFRTPTGDINLGARVAVAEYSRSRYGSPLDWGVNAGTEQIISANVDARVSLRFDDSFPQTSNRLADLTPGDPLPIEDPSFQGRQTRRKTYSAEGGLGIRLDQRNRLDFTAGASALRVSKAARNGNNDSYDFSVAASNQVNSKLSLGASVRYSQFNYNSAGNETRVIAPAAVASWKLDGHTTLDFTAGTSLIKSKSPFGDQKSTSVYADISLCNKTTKTSVCGTLGQYTEPTAFDGVRNTTRAGTTLNYQIDRKTRVSGYASFIRTKGTGIILRNSFEYFSFGTSINREISRPLYVFAQTRFGDIYSRNDSRRANAGITLGVSYRFGS